MCPPPKHWQKRRLWAQHQCGQARCEKSLAELCAARKVGDKRRRRDVPKIFRIHSNQTRQTGLPSLAKMTRPSATALDESIEVKTTATRVHFGDSVPDLNFFSPMHRTRSCDVDFKSHEGILKNKSRAQNGGPPANLLINQGVRDNVSGHTTRAPPGRVRTDNQLVVSSMQGPLLQTETFPKPRFERHVSAPLRMQHDRNCLHVGHVMFPPVPS